MKRDLLCVIETKYMVILQREPLLAAVAKFNEKIHFTISFKVGVSGINLLK